MRGQGQGAMGSRRQGAMGARSFLARMCLCICFLARYGLAGLSARIMLNNPARPTSGRAHVPARPMSRARDHAQAGTGHALCPSMGACIRRRLTLALQAQADWRRPQGDAQGNRWISAPDSKTRQWLEGRPATDGRESITLVGEAAGWRGRDTGPPPWGGVWRCCCWKPRQTDAKHQLRRGSILFCDCALFRSSLQRSR